MNVCAEEGSCHKPYFTLENEFGKTLCEPIMEGTHNASRAHIVASINGKGDPKICVCSFLKECSSPLYQSSALAKVYGIKV